MHTPGPWKVTRRMTKEGGCDRGIWIYGNDRTVFDSGALDVFPLRDDDAALIAAAPDLLSACKQVLDDIGDRLTGKTVIMLRKAIKKAEQSA